MLHQLSCFLKSLDYKVVVPLLIASFSPLLALLALYYNDWKPFKLNVYGLGRYSLSVSTQNVNHVAISLPLNFENEGARAGVIENLRANIVDSNGKKRLLIPLFTIASRKMNMLGEKIGLDAESFVAFGLKPKETLTKNIMFVPYNSSEFLPIGSYKLTVFAKTSKNNRWQEYKTMSIVVDTSDMQEIMKGVPKDGGFVMANFRDKIMPNLDEEYKNFDKTAQ